MVFKLWRGRRKMVALTGVGAVLTATHRPPYGTGDFHEHTWEITVWFRDYPHNAEIPQHYLNQYVQRYVGKPLPDRLSRAEDLAADIWRDMTEDFGAYVLRVDIARHAERLYASWPA